MKTALPRADGFTIIELMVVITIVGVLAMIALPSFKSLSQGQRVKNASFELYTAFNLARSEAIKRNGNVTITPVMYPVSNPTLHNEFGWTIADANGATIQNHPQLVGIAITTNPAIASVTYQRSGRTTTTVPPMLIDAYGVTTSYASCIKIELSGMPRTYKPVNGAC